MFIVLLKFSKNKDQVQDHLQDHVAWITKGFDDGVFHLAGNLNPMEGGGIIAHGVSREELEARIAEDPFVVNDVVTADYIEINASRTSEAFTSFLEPGS